MPGDPGPGPSAAYSYRSHRPGTSTDTRTGTGTSPQPLINELTTERKLAASHCPVTTGWPSET